MNIICMGNIGWDYLWQRPQQIMSRLAVNNKVLYIEEQKSIFGVIKNFDFSIIRKQNNVLILTPIGVPFGLQKMIFFNKLNFLLLYFTIIYINKKYRLNQPILWFYNINLYNLIGKMNKSLIIYDCVDEHNAFTGSTDNDRMNELRLIRLSDIVFTSSERLFTNKARFSNDIYMVKNAVDAEHFVKSINTNESDKLLNINKPIVGYVGAIWDWLDLDLIAFLAKSHPEISIVLIGPVNIDISLMCKFHNVYFIGKKPYKDLPEYIKNFDVCIIPFKINELTQNADPIKLYEYMATGKPIVSTDLQEVRKFPCVKISRNYEDFVRNIIESISNERSEIQVKMQIDSAMENSWSARVNEMERIIRNKLVK